MRAFTRPTPAGLACTLLTSAALVTTAAMATSPLSAHGASAGQTIAASGEPAGPPVRLPANPSGLPAPTKSGAESDPFASYQPQSACSVTPSRGIVKLRALALATYGRGGSSPAYPRVCTSGGTSEHKDGRAWDWMLHVGNRADRKVSADFLGWLTGAGPTGIRGEMAARLGVMYVIYNHKSWSSYNRVWKDYTGDDPHTSHIHISLSWNGARATTSFWTGRVWSTDYGPCRVFTSQPAVVPTAIARTRPCGPAVLSPRGSSLPFGWIGSTGAAVSLAQRTLGTAPTGRFDATTRAAVLRYQRTHDLPRTGTLDKPTWASLRPLSLRLNVPDWRAGEALDWALSRGTVPSLHRASAGTAVYALQVALKLPPAWRTGFFGARTAAAVVAVKRAVGLPATVVVNAAVWQAIADSR